MDIFVLVYVLKCIYINRMSNLYYDCTIAILDYLYSC